jgi:O-antigen ligase
MKTALQFHPGSAAADAMVAEPIHLGYGLAFLVIIASGLVDLPGQFSIGAISIEGILSILYLLSGTLLLLLMPTRGSLFSARQAPLLVFGSLAGISLAWSSAPLVGFQNIVALGTFLVLLRVSEAAATLDRSFGIWIDRAMRYSALLAAAIYAGSLVWFGPGTSQILGARSFSVFALFGVANLLAKWRYGHHWAMWAAIALTLLIGASQSRLALAIAIILFPLAQFPGASRMRIFKMCSVMIAVCFTFYEALLYFDSLRNRFLTGDMSLKLGNWAINVSGRLAFWRVITESFKEAPIFGKGAGSAQAVIDMAFAGIHHPHNDYLRILHDYGLFGMALWLVAIGTLVLSLWRHWLLADRLAMPQAHLYLSGLLTLVAFALEMTTDNVIVYAFVVAPLGLILGSALGLRQVRRMVASLK